MTSLSSAPPKPPRGGRAGTPGDSPLGRRAADFLSASHSVAPGARTGHPCPRAPGLYVHVPYCATKCPYCAFVSAPARDLPPMEAYVDALLCELDRLPGPFGTAFVGGGTPTALPARLLRRVLAAVAERTAPGAEISVEANPRTVTAEKAEVLAERATRVSVGVQAADAEGLAALGRAHDRADAEATIGLLRSAGIANLNVDLIFGWPGQTRAAWRATLDWAVGLGTPHLALYDLSIEEGTAFARDGIEPLGTDASADLYEDAIETPTTAGFEQYEVSNFARPGHECRHNLGYWLYREYAGAGASAHSFTGGERRWNTPSVETYIEAVRAGLSPVAGHERLEGPARAGEALVLALRLPGGIAVDDLPAPVPDEIRRHKTRALERLAARGLLEWDGTRLAPTRRGIFLLDEVCSYLV